MIKSFSKFLLEGGNVKIKTSSGEIHTAEPINIYHRQTQAHEIHSTLSALHDSFHKEHGSHLFGADKKALQTKSAYSGSTKHLMNDKISDSEFTKHKPSVGDIDVQVPKEHMENLHKHLMPGKTFGNYSVVGTAKHGSEISAVMKHNSSGANHQFDFEATHYHKNEPTKFEQFSHSSDWEDTKAGIKGLHHKMLLNAVGGDHHKFSITHGLRSRTDESDPGVREPHEITHKLFGSSANAKHIHSFTGMTNLIKNHLPNEEHQRIYDKFKDSVSKIKKASHTSAIAHLKKNLNVKDSVTESTEKTYHTTVTPLVGFSPISHMGHSADLGSAMHKLPGTKHLGISSKADVFSPEERKSILNKQWKNHGETNIHVVKSGGETFRKAHDSLPSSGRKVLHILVGKDRANFAHGFKKSLESGKVKEMEGRHFDEIHIHHPKDENRSHGLSGTNMRAAAQSGDYKTFSKHLGSMFTPSETVSTMKKIKSGLDSGVIKVKRPK